MSRWMMAAVLAGLVSVAAWAAPPARAADKISIPSETPASMMEFLQHTGAPATVVGFLSLPDHVSGPVPAMILKHGSAGLDGPNGENIRKWARTLNEWGVATLIVDSFGPRGIDATAADQGKLRTLADLEDTLSALKVLAADPRIDASRIGVMGWSRGAEPAMQSALATMRHAVLGDGGPKFAAHVVFYGPANIQYRDRATDGSPFLFLHGEADDYVPMGPTQEWADWLKSMGNPVSFVTYPKTYHDFDVEGARDGFVRGVETSKRCDVVFDLSSGAAHVVRMDHQTLTSTTPQAYLAYLKSCGDMGADLYYNGQARADAVEKVHDFLRQALHLAG